MFILKKFTDAYLNAPFSDKENKLDCLNAFGLCRNFN